MTSNKTAKPTKRPRGYHIAVSYRMIEVEVEKYEHWYTVEKCFGKRILQEIAQYPDFQSAHARAETEQTGGVPYWQPYPID